MLSGGMSGFGLFVSALPALPALPPAPIPVRVEFEAPPACSTADAFFAGVRARSDRVRLANEGEAARALHVRLTRTGATVQGELRVSEEQGDTDTRRVSGASCDEVVEALSLTAALALDPAAHLVPSTKPEPAPPPVPPAPPVTVPPRQPAPEAPRAPGVELGLQAQIAELVSSQASSGGALFARVTAHTRAGVDPSFGLAFAHLRNDALSAPHDLSLAWTAFTLSACPTRGAPSDRFEIEPCGVFSAGWLAASGRDLTNPESVVRTWWSAGAALRGFVRLDGGFALELEADAALPLVRRRFVTHVPDRRVGETPTIAVSGGLGLAYRF